MPTYYHAGTDSPLPFVLNVDIDPTFDQTDFDMRVRWIEFWCQQYCSGAWSLDQQRHSVKLGFSNNQDRLLFKLSQNDDRLAL